MVKDGTHTNSSMHVYNLTIIVWLTLLTLRLGGVSCKSGVRYQDDPRALASESSRIDHVTPSFILSPLSSS